MVNADIINISMAGGDCPSGCIYHHYWTIKVGGREIELIEEAGTICKKKYGHSRNFFFWNLIIIMGILKNFIPKKIWHFCKKCFMICRYYELLFNTIIS